MIFSTLEPIVPNMDRLMQQLLNPVNLFNKLDIFDEAVERAKRLDYKVYELDCRSYHSEKEILNAVSRTFGGNGDFRYLKGKRDYEEYWVSYNPLPLPQYGAENAALIAFREFDTFHRRDPECAQALLNVLAVRHYWDLKAGNRLLVCVHHQQPYFRVEPTLRIKVKSNTVPCFSKQADIEQEERDRELAWIDQVRDQLRLEGDADIESVDVAVALALRDSNLSFDLLGPVPEAKPRPSFEAAVRIVKEHRAKRKGSQQSTQ
ncbi:hypothetical protein EON80_17365 [bacterium]|nr:MAG: hypothetical protein EON80_17365 [bacterium]